MDNKEVQKPFRPGKKRKKVCNFCAEKTEMIDYKDVLKLRKYVSERSKILPRRITGTCAKHQSCLLYTSQSLTAFLLLLFLLP